MSSCLVCVALSLRALLVWTEWVACIIACLSFVFAAVVFDLGPFKIKNKLKGLEFNYL